MAEGYLYWAQPGPYPANPSRFTDQVGPIAYLHEAITWKHVDSGGVILVPNAAGGHTEIVPFRGGSGPWVKKAWQGSFSLNVQDEELVKVLERASQYPGAVELLLGWPLMDRLYAVDGQTLFSLSRMLPFGDVCGDGVVTEDTHPVSATLNGTPQTVIYGSSPDPSTGEVGIVTTARAQHLCVVTPALESADVLEVRYRPLQKWRISPSYGNPAFGQFTQSYELEESLSGRWD